VASRGWPMMKAQSQPAGYGGGSVDSAAQKRRVPYRQGEGERLRQDILDTATRIAGRPRW